MRRAVTVSEQRTNNPVLKYRCPLCGLWMYWSFLELGWYCISCNLAMPTEQIEAYIAQCETINALVNTIKKEMAND